MPRRSKPGRHVVTINLTQPPELATLRLHQQAPQQQIQTCGGLLQARSAINPFRTVGPIGNPERRLGQAAIDQRCERPCIGWEPGQGRDAWDLPAMLWPAAGVAAAALLVVGSAREDGSVRC